jgi:threonine-phosphate decarboxylase
MSGCDMAFLCNPNNPTGSLLNKEDVLKISDAAEKRKCYLVVDEAFMDFTPEESVISNALNNPYLIVLRSMTKFYALTGLRAGYGVFHSDLIPEIKKHKEPWTVNNLAQNAAVTALEDRDYADKTMQLIKDEKEYIENNLSRLAIKYFPSSVNYYLLKLNNAAGVINELSHKGILVRDCSNFKGLDSSYIRVAVKAREHNEMIIRELTESCRE